MVLTKVGERDLGALCFTANGPDFFHASWKKHRLDRRAQAGVSGVYLSSSFMHLSFEYLLIVCMAVGLRVECVFVCG